MVKIDRVRRDEETQARRVDVMRRIDRLQDLDDRLRFVGRHVQARV
jgi:hypothetical protein